MSTNVTSSGLSNTLGLGPDSYTAHRLQHATPDHLHITTRRCFIGPIPEGWLNSHRKSWYQHQLHLNYSSRVGSFTASHDVSQHRQITGLDGPSVSARHGHSFPRPKGLDEEEEDVDEEGDQRIQTTADETSELPAPRSSSFAGDRTHEDQNNDSEVIGNALGPPPTSLEPPPAKIRTSSASRSRPKPIPGKNRPPPSANTADSFVTARENLTSPEKYKDGGASLETYKTAPEIPESSALQGEGSVKRDDKREAEVRTSSSANGVPADASNSTASLLNHDARSSERSLGNRGDTRSPKGILSKIKKQSKLLSSNPQDGLDGANEESGAQKTKAPVSSGLVRFNIPDEGLDDDQQRKLRVAKMNKRRSIKRFRGGKVHDGEIIKMEKMLVRADSTMQDLPDDYDENESIKVETRAVEKWREFVVVCRESVSGDAEFILQLYKTRVIPEIDKSDVAKRSMHEIPLSRKTTKVNLYSSLDKTVVIWVPWKKGKMIYIMRPRSSSNSVEWYTFLRNALGSDRTTVLQINVPDLNLSLRLNNPFEQVEASRDAAQAAEDDEAAIVRTMEEEQAAAGNIIRRCLEMLKESGEWTDVLETWSKSAKIGLAWKRYDRLEWVHGANEQKMYGTLAMQRSHELELRLKEHYPTNAPTNDEASSEDGETKHPPLREPPPVEGFLIRLTSQRGRDQRFGKLFFKRLYFATHNQYLCFCKPAKALPPPPPKLPMSQNSRIPTANQIIEKTPLIYAVKPYELNDGEIAWLEGGTSATREMHDQDAYEEAERKINTILQCDGYINLNNVDEVRSVVRGTTPADDNVDQGSDVDFHQDVTDTDRDDGDTKEFDDDRTFELAMDNGLVIRLQAYNKVTKKEWIHRLRDIVRYWKLRVAADMDLFKAVRRANLMQLNIDEEMESLLGQFARKWEVTRSVASPQLYNMCGISCCRIITKISGILYRKPRRHATFTRCGVILCHGNLIIFQDSLRKRTGEEVPHIQHERSSIIDLKDCYIYSGLITEGDLLYQNQTFDSNNPGHHPLPRVYLEDGWTSSDEDSMTCFVVWQARKKSYFKSSEVSFGGRQRQRLRKVSQLGVPGRSIVFMTRSRAERDHWVMSIGMEIERLQQAEEIRVVSKDKTGV
ncbi:MAG: hypothetical protein M1812_005866 [Candelaria pacifica]|nr:MAG: hypothetical protein M1812_005866 [Candelaria pacifica]